MVNINSGEMNMKIKLIKNKISLLMILGIFVTGCATTSSIEVISKNALEDNFSIDTLVAKNETGKVFDIDVESLLSKAVNKELTIQNLSGKGGLAYELKISIIQYDEGNAFARWMVPGMGKTILSVEAVLYDEIGKAVAQSQATRSIGAGGGYTINAWSRVFDQVAKQLVDDLVSAR